MALFLKFKASWTPQSQFFSICQNPTPFLICFFWYKTTQTYFLTVQELEVENGLARSFVTGPSGSFFKKIN